MKIVADQNIPLLQNFFSHLGEIVSLSGRDITNQDLLDCDVLLVRSVTKVNESLLKNTPVKFVGTCTIGIDHLDTNYLDQHNIQWANAPGCNANAVVQYVFSVLATLMSDWPQKTVGIIGCGNIGKRLHARFKKLGVSVLCYDPFLDATEQENLVSFEEVLTADIVTIHTPLTKAGAYPSYHLLGEEAFSHIKKGAVIINSCRGGVIDEQALLEVMPSKAFKVTLDVWENEPTIDFKVLDQVSIATPHIAGYTLEGRENGTSMVYEALCDYLKVQAQDKNTILSVATRPWNNTVVTTNTLERLNEVLLSCYPILHDDKTIRAHQTSELPFPQYFDGLRKNYPERREYTHYDFPKWNDDSDLHAMMDIIRNG